MPAASKPKKDRKRAAPKVATPRGVQKKKQLPEVPSRQALQETAQAALTAGQAGTHPYVGAAVVLPLTQGVPSFLKRTLMLSDEGDVFAFAVITQMLPDGGAIVMMEHGSTVTLTLSEVAAFIQPPDSPLHAKYGGFVPDCPRAAVTNETGQSTVAATAATTVNAGQRRTRNTGPLAVL